jgi:decaprenylphospho-beta-D-ribofuranose 2-oxidase
LRGKPQLLSGWGRTPTTAARLECPANADEATSIIMSARERGAIPRGLGRSYGDAAQNAGGTVVSTAALGRIVDLDLDGAVARVEAGVSLDQLMRTVVPLGLWPAVTPGTRQVTVGGAIASDVHGKNHHRDGTFAAHVGSFVIATPGCGPLTASPSHNPEVFWATAGGMGLTGLILEATLNLVRIETGYMRVSTERHPDLDSLMARMVEVDRACHYSVAWVDCLAGGPALGRSILECGDHAQPDDLPVRLRTPERLLAFRTLPSIAIPGLVPSQTLNPLTLRAFNLAWYRKAPRRTENRITPLASFFHPLDALAEWNRLYGPRGFIQYQIVLPDEAASLLRAVIETLSRERCAGFLGVLKRFGAANRGPMSFPKTGWTLAVDLPARLGAGLGALLDHLDTRVAEAGGRVYLTKDSRLRPELLGDMYPDLLRWRAIRDRLDPDRTLSSDLARRVWTLLDDRPPWRNRARCEAGAAGS